VPPVALLPLAVVVPPVTLLPLAVVRRPSVDQTNNLVRNALNEYTKSVCYSKYMFME
jgi:predicted lipid carrier protein YhbT